MVKEAKCIVWDLDNTIWEGTLLESENVSLKPGIKEIIIDLDSKGILHSIASKNNYSDAMEKLNEFGLSEYFLYPQINWNPKSVSILRIQEKLNIGLDTIIFIDDESFERDEVVSVIPEIECIDAIELKKLLTLARLTPRFFTTDTQRRRVMYLEDQERDNDEKSFWGTREEFLGSLNMVLTISTATKEDLERALELTLRTNQLNSTGIIYSFDELLAYLNSDDHVILICELTDKYGSYGKIGLSLNQITEDSIHIKLLLMSCRVLSRGLGTVLLSNIMQQAKRNNLKLYADFKQTGKNKLMYMTYKFENFKEVSNDGENIILENDLSIVKSGPKFMTINTKWEI